MARSLYYSGAENDPQQPVEFKARFLVIRVKRVDQNADKKSFLPRDKPKSWIVFVISMLVGLLVAGPLAIVGIVFQIGDLESAGRLLFICSWSVGVAMWFVFISHSIRGRYKNIKESNWSEQLW